MLIKDKSRSIIKNATIFLFTIYVLGYSLPYIAPPLLESVNKVDQSKKDIPSKSDLAEQRAAIWAARRGYRIDYVDNAGNGQVLILYTNPRTGLSGGEYFYY